MVNSREHRTIRRRPIDALADERRALPPVPATAHTIAHGIGRKVPVNTPMVTFENAQYSVPSELLGAEVFVRLHGTGDQAVVVIAHVGDEGPVEVARHRVARPGSPSIIDAHFPDHDPAKVPGDYTIVRRSAEEAEFLGIGAGARSWLLEAAAAGTGEVDKALGVAAVHHRFAHGDLASLLNAAGHDAGQHAATEDKSLTQGTGGWAGLGATGTTGTEEGR